MIKIPQKLNPNFVIFVTWIIIMIPLLLRSLHVNTYVFDLTGAEFHGAPQVLAHDAPIYAFIFIMFYLSFLLKTPTYASILLRLAGFSVLYFYMTDVFIITQFNTHLVLDDAVKYGGDGYLYMLKLYNFFLLIPLALTLLIIASPHKLKGKAIHCFSLLVIAISLGGAGFREKENYVHSWLYSNVIDYNLSIISASKPYSAKFASKPPVIPVESCQIKQAAQNDPNIIILMVESLSSYQSDLFSGLNNWMPQIDMIASEGIALTNFHANGFNTEDGEIALLTGRLPINKTAHYINTGGITFFKGFFSSPQSLPQILNQKGYATEFLTTSTLDFSDTGEWVGSLGFDYIEGHQHPYYNQWPRFAFYAAPDEALYNRVIERVKHNQGNKSFLFIKTATTHHPFINPENNKHSESETFQYADKQIGVFYQRLKELDYFDNGMLIIVGDHHAMVPIKSAEIEKFGKLKAPAMIPAIISYGGRKTAILSQAYQQTDIYNGLKNLVSEKHCHSKWRGDPISTAPKPAHYIAHRRGDQRELITVFANDEGIEVKLDGDNTRIRDTSNNKPNERHESYNEIIDMINHTRL